MTKASKKRAQPDHAGSSTGVASTADEEQASGKKTRTSAASGKRAKGISGVPGSLHDERRCTATANRTGERCKAPAIKGGNVCRMHGGSLPNVRKSARERLTSMVEPALTELNRIINDPDTDDTVKVRSIQIVLDRTGFQPGMNIAVHAESEWERGVREALTASNGELAIDRDLEGGDDASVELAAYNALQLANDARDEAWREFDSEDAEAFERGRIRPDERTIVGEVVHEADRSRYPGPYDAPPDRDPNKPPRYVDEAARRARASGD